MANNFKRYTSRGIGTAPTTVGAYTVPGSTQVTIIGLSVSNTSNNAVTVTAVHYDGADATNLVKNAPLMVGSTIVIVGGDQKLVLQTGDSIRVNSSLASSVDVVMSVLEVT